MIKQLGDFSQPVCQWHGKDGPQLQERVRLDFWTFASPYFYLCWPEHYKSQRISTRRMSQVHSFHMTLQMQGLVCRWGNGSINLVIIRCGQPCLQAAENTLLPCITAAVGEAMTCELKMILPSHQTMYWPMQICSIHQSMHIKSIFRIFLTW